MLGNEESLSDHPYIFRINRRPLVARAGRDGPVRWAFSRLDAELFRESVE